MTDTIILLTDREKVRERPGMYIGDIGKVGLATIVREVVDNAFDEYPNYADKTKPIVVTLYPDNSVSVRDHGRGISPYESKANPGQIEERLAFTRLGAGGKMKANRGLNQFKFSAGLHGVGASATNFMSSFFDVTIFKPDGIYHDRFENGGLPVVELIDNTLPKRENESGETGTLIHFKPDPAVMSETKISATTLKTYFGQMKYLHQGITIIFDNKRDDELITYHAEDGLLSYLTDIMTSEDGFDLFGDPALVSGEATKELKGESIDMQVNIALGLSKSASADVKAFTNATYNELNGTHVDGFYKGCLQLVRHYYTTFQSEYDTKFKNQISVIKKLTNTTDISKLFKRKHMEHLWYGIIDLKHTSPILQPQTKDRLASEEVVAFVTGVVFDKGRLFFDKRIKQINHVIEYIIKDLYEKAKDDDASTKISRADAKLLTSTKLSSAKTKKPEEAEIFLLEGDSAAGTAKSNRDPHFQAILPLRGKILNVQNATTKSAFDNSEVATFFAAIGTGYGKQFNIKKLKYHRIIIATDQDVDGLHIRTLIITMIWKYAPDLILNGHVYILDTPLYINVLKNKKTHFTYSQVEQDAYLAKKPNVSTITRNKGLGELGIEQTIISVLDPKTRRLSQLTVRDVEALDRTIEKLMSDRLEHRRYRKSLFMKEGDKK